MKCKKWMSLVLCLIMALTMTACAGNENAVYVQRVGDLMGLGGIAPGDRFAGLVVSENVTEIQKDNDKTIAELKVKEGDDVKAGQPLFAYDTEELQLTLDKQRLELEQLNASIENYKRQIEDLEKERKKAGTAAKLQYTVQIQTAQVDLKEAELNVKAKETEVQKSESILENAVVEAPVAGRIRSINDNNSTDQNGKPLPYIVIQQAGAYRIKGTLGELQRGGIVEGNQMHIFSRTDENQSWTGTVTLVDYESPIDDNNGNYGMSMMGSNDEMTSSSKYPFYVDLDSTEGLLLGQHVYMELSTGAEEAQAGISSAFLVLEEDGSAYVWAENKGRLEKRPVTLGEYNPQNDTYPVTEGLTEDDFIAFPDPELCAQGVPTTHEYVAPEPGEEGGMAEGMIDEGMINEGVIDEGMAEEGVIEGGVAEEGVMGEAAPVEGEVSDGMTSSGDADMAESGGAAVSGGEMAGGEAKETISETEASASGKGPVG